MNSCVVCEKPLAKYHCLQDTYYCVSPRCTNLGLLTVMVLTPQVTPKTEEIKDDKDLQTLGGTGTNIPSGGSRGGS